MALARWRVAVCRDRYGCWANLRIGEALGGAPASPRASATAAVARRAWAGLRHELAVTRRSLGSAGPLLCFDVLSASSARVSTSQHATTGTSAGWCGGSRPSNSLRTLWLASTRIEIAVPSPVPADRSMWGAWADLLAPRPASSSPSRPWARARQPLVVSPYTVARTMG